ncbi:MAG: four helix bundle protein [Bacteroidales bacterium]|jgi:four helix bundle protein|nr:four helix bundle protein [Bacteroidales bacterium]
MKTDTYKEKDLKIRTKKFSLDTIDIVENMDYSIAKKVVMTQIVRSGTSVGANFRATQRARSDNEFIAKMNIVLEEVDECIFWLEIINDKKWYNVEDLLKEANELTSIFVSILKTMNNKKTTQNSKL